MTQPTKVYHLKKVILDSVVELLVNVGACAETAEDHREIIWLCKACITDSIEELNLTREEAFAMIDKIATELKATWDEIRETHKP